MKQVFDSDVLAASRQWYAWYENDGGSPPSFTRHVISIAVRSGQSVFASDVDGDGDTDILSASSGETNVAWYENDGGAPPHFTEWVISDTAEDAQSVFAADLDGDGDTDVLSASFIDDQIAWYENTTCGDGMVEGNEACDDRGESATCDADCTAVECGDSTRNILERV